MFTLLARTYEGESGAREGRRVWEEAGRGLWTPTRRTPSAADDVDEQDADEHADAVDAADAADTEAESEDDGDGEEPGEGSNDA